ncbi:hypothetical protein CDL15_Pgr027806 [Punica granatum]|nr:hypothetical protein CDL15_Pgr027806 [Punica granatum]
MAKDLRQFVQSFNMSRQFSNNPVTLPPQNDSETVEEAAYRISGDRDRRKQKRSDWTEYLDLEDATCAEEACDGDVNIVTELPEDMFKKPRMKDYPSQLGKQAEHAKLYRPIFSKSHVPRNAACPGIDARKSQRGDSGAEDKIIKLDGHPPFATSARASKWNSYITEDYNVSQFGSQKNLSDETGHQNFNAFTLTISDQKVEDDIHPDFV